MVVNDSNVAAGNQLSARTFEVEMSKKTIHLDLPMHIGCFVYQYAKLRMLEFYYDFMDVFVDCRHFQYCPMDIDSAYMALSATSLEEVTKPLLLEEWQTAPLIPLKDVDRVLPDIVSDLKKTLLSANAPECRQCQVLQ